jgi:hypothetical protein
MNNAEQPHRILQAPDWPNCIALAGFVPNPSLSRTQ